MRLSAKQKLHHKDRERLGACSAQWRTICISRERGPESQHQKRKRQGEGGTSRLVTNDIRRCEGQRKLEGIGRKGLSQAWWYLPVIAEFGGQWQEEGVKEVTFRYMVNFKPSLGYVK